MIRKFIHYYGPHKKLFFADMLCSFFIAVCELFYPMITRNILNEYIPNQNIRLVVLWCGALAVIYIIKALLNYFVQYYGHVVGVRMQADMRKQVFEKLQRLPFSFFDENKTGDIMSRIVTDLMDISELAHHGPEDLFLSALMIIGSFILLCTINVPLTLIIFAFIPLLIWFSLAKRIKMNKAFARSRREVGKINASLENSISGIRVSRAFTSQRQELDKFQSSNNAFKHARSQAYKAMAEFFSGTNFITDIINVVVLLAGALFIAGGHIVTGDFFAYVLYISLLLNPIKKLINFMEMYQNAMTGFRRYLDLMEQPEEQEAEGARALVNVQGHIVFQDVCFSYGESDDSGQDTDSGRLMEATATGRGVLNHINLDIPAGEMVALVGPSGGGKTTLCHLIPRFYEITAGSIFIDGQDIRTLTLDSLRKAIGIVQQDVFLFSGTLYENILYGRPDATEEEVYRAAKQANIHEYVMGLPKGYQTQIGERGVKLSGGQKQRLSIARVFLKNPPILILDEATSALDNATELLIQNALNELAKGRTTIVVAHRLSTIKNADEIVVLDSQGIQEQGSHQDLLDRNGVYAALYKAQFTLEKYK